MPERFNLGVRALVGVIGGGGLIIGYLSQAPDLIGLEPALSILNSTLLGFVLGLLWLLHTDLEHMETGNVDSNDDEISPDGGIRLSPRLRELREESPEGGGALAGLVAGGAVGLLGGPLGVVIGGIAGGLLGNEAEYQQIVNEYREELGRTAKDALAKERIPPARPYSVENINHRSTDDTYLVILEDVSGDRHGIRLNLDDKSYEYEKVQ